MSYVHLTTSARVNIETYLELGFSIRKIANLLECHPSTILCELKRIGLLHLDKLSFYLN
nr:MULTISPECIES: helix-turn-helix domain-containing protein [unclassified Exiguobacterium]